MLENRILNIYCYLTGIFFIISGLGKVINTTAFSQLIYEYGLGYLMILAPLIAIVEISVGISLVLLINPKRNSFAACVLLIMFTIAFAYAHFKNGINDCGCFGTWHPTNISPFFLFARNAILLIMSLIVWITYRPFITDPDILKKRIRLSVVSLSIFIAGFTFSTPFFISSDKEKNKFQNKNIKNTPFSKYIKTSPDSTYLLFCFSYTCSHCWNSIENFRKYKREKIVDNIISLAIGSDSDKAVFEKNFLPDFYIQNLSSMQMRELTDVFPTAFYVKNDSIKIVIMSELPSHVTFKKDNFLSLLN